MNGKDVVKNGCESKAERDSKVHSGWTCHGVDNRNDDNGFDMPAFGDSDFKRKRRVGGNGLWDNVHSAPGILYWSSCIVQAGRASKNDGLCAVRRTVPLYAVACSFPAVWRETGHHVASCTFCNRRNHACGCTERKRKAGERTPKKEAMIDKMNKKRT